MANSMTHLIVGGLSGLSVALCDKDNKAEMTHNPLLATAIGTLFGKLPDILEPALNNPHHRQFYHSIVILAVLGYGVKKASEWKPEDNLGALSRGLVLFAGVGYISHLLLDATTPRSLLILGKI